MSGGGVSGPRFTGSTSTSAARSAFPPHIPERKHRALFGAYHWVTQISLN